MLIDERRGLRGHLRTVAWDLQQDLKRFCFHVLANTILGSTAVPRRLRSYGYRCLGMEVAPSANIWPLVYFATRDVSIGARVMVNTHCRFENVARVSLADDVSVGPGAVFLTSTHAFGPRERRAGDLERKAVSVATGAWVGAHALVLPGVVIGSGSVVAAGSVVPSDVGEDVLVAGAPARVVRSLTAP